MPVPPTCKSILACAAIASACAAADPPPAAIAVAPQEQTTPQAQSAQPLAQANSAPSSTSPRAVAPASVLTPLASPAPPSYREPVVPSEQTRALALMYHVFNRGSGDLSVNGSQFDNQIQWLADNHVEIVPLEDLIRFLDGERDLPARVAVITIDDGDRSVYEIAWPILLRHRAPFTLGLPTNLMQQNKRHRMLTWDQVREMMKSGLCSVASHGHEHRSIVHFSDRDALAQLEESKRILREQTGTDPAVFVYPLGAFDARTSRIVRKAGFVGAFKATGGSIASDRCDRFALPRVGIAHRDTVGTLGFFFSKAFLDRFPFVPRPAP